MKSNFWRMAAENRQHWRIKREVALNNSVKLFKHMHSNLTQSSVSYNCHMPDIWWYLIDGGLLKIMSFEGFAWAAA